MAGPVAIAVASAQIPAIILSNYGSVLLASNNSRAFAYLIIVSAVCKILLIIAGLSLFGMLGAILAPAISTLLVYPLVARYAHRYRAWDPMFDALMLGAGAVMIAVTCWLHLDSILSLTHV